MSNTDDPQHYDPYLYKLQEYERQLKEISQILNKSDNKTKFQDYNTLISLVEEIIKNIQIDIKEREEEPLTEPDYGKAKSLWWQGNFGKGK